MCEKPMTLSMDEAKAIIAEVEKGKAKFMIGQVCRYAPAFVLAKKLISEGMIGDLYFVESEYAHDYGVAPGANNWRVDPRREPMIGGGCHAVDLLRWIAGDPEEVMAYGVHKTFAEVVALAAEGKFHYEDGTPVNFDGMPHSQIKELVNEGKVLFNEDDVINLRDKISAIYI